ncbi:DUF2264 domain-containing protein [Niabella terrae]
MSDTEHFSSWGTCFDICRLKLLLTGWLVYFFGLLPVGAQQPASASFTKPSDADRFEVKDPDFLRSPYTGMTRKHWHQAALYLLSGAFSYIKNWDDPMRFPQQPGKSYPRSKDQMPTEKLEGLCRTLFIAAPLLKENPDLRFGQIGVADYYRHQILKLLDPQSDTYIPKQLPGGGPSQILVELGALSVSLFYIPELLFDPLTPEQKDRLAATMLSYGDGKTVPSNWKFFNIFILSFFKSRGYTVNEPLLKDYLEKSLAHYRGDGWYNDNPAYDYYSMWAFQMYGPLWAHYFGDRFYPEIAARFRQHFEALKPTYPYMFGRDGKMIIWGRSMSYRIAAAVPFALMGLRPDAQLNYGWMRRIASGVLQQFLTHPGFMQDRVPTLGIYGPFEPAVQPYSCRGSVYWMGKVFFALLLPPDNPFWTATENNGDWDQPMKKDTVYHHFADTAGILITDYPNSGAAEIRSWCKVKLADAWEKFRASENYNRLSYNSAFPWQADSVAGVAAMNYLVRNSRQQWECLRLYDFKKFEKGVYYRSAVLESDSSIRFQLADIPIANGILRVDQISSNSKAPVRLGHYGLPQLGQPLRRYARTVKGHQVRILDNGIFQLAFVNLRGWDQLHSAVTTHVHPASDTSEVLYASGQLRPATSRLFISLLLWKKSGTPFTEQELLPVKEVLQNQQGLQIDLGRNGRYNIFN